MKKKFLFFIFFSCISIGNAQTLIKGLIKDESNMSAISDATIRLKGTNESTKSNEDGSFSLNTSKSGMQTLEISFVGYSSFEKKINLDVLKEELNVFLKANSQQLEEVILTATSIKRSQKETPLSITSFGVKQLSNLGTSSQADILTKVPGITAEGGGGEAASNIFVRGLPSGGQYQFNPLQIDGMPVLSTFGLNSSAHDVYFRNDIGIKSLEFVRGGSSILYGVGSVAGIINYTSAQGSDTPKTVLKTEMASNARYKADFLTSGSFGENSKLYYAFSGFYRYDQGPIKTGLDTEGFQLRGNIKKVTNDGSITFSGQFIDDKVQFYLPYPLEGGTRNRPVGNDGNTIYTLQTAAASDISYRTPNGIYHSQIEDGIATKGGYFMVDFKHIFNESFKLDAKLRYSNYKHQFNFFLDGSGVTGSKAVETQAEYMSARNINTGSFIYLNGQSLNSNARLYENRITDRIRPINELVSDIKVSKSFNNHNLTLGTFMSRSTAGDFNVTTRYLSEYNNQPELINLSGYSVNGVTKAGLGYVNRNISSNKIAIYLADEIKLERWNLDFGFRSETATGVIENEKTQTYNGVGNSGLANIDNIVWGNGYYQRAKVNASDFAFSAAALYKVNEDLSTYANFSKGYFFPELRSVKFNSLDKASSYEPEKILQSELGLKYGKSNFSGTLALYTVSLKDRRIVNFINDPNTGGLIEDVDKQSTYTIGLESTFNYKFIKNTSFNGSFTYQDHKITKAENDATFEGNRISRQPKLLSTFSLEYDNSKYDFVIDYNYSGSKFTNDANTVKLDGFGLTNINLGYTLKFEKNSEKIRLGVQVYNLFNSVGITEGSPRLNNLQTEEQFFVGRPVLPTRLFFNLTFNF